MTFTSFSFVKNRSNTSQLILQPFPCFTYVTAHSPTLPFALLTSQLILQPFSCFTYITVHSPTLLSQSSFSKLSVTSSTSQLILILQIFRHFTYVTAILEPFRRFTYVTAHSPTLPLVHLRHSSFSNPSFASPTLHKRHNSFSNTSVALPRSQLILQPFRHFTYVTAHSPTIPLLHLRHSLFSNPSFASPTSQALHLILLASRPCCEIDRRTAVARSLMAFTSAKRAPLMAAFKRRNWKKSARTCAAQIGRKSPAYSNHRGQWSAPCPC